eukprot:13623-Heterococcus_DN1.PRE.3
MHYAGVAALSLAECSVCSCVCLLVAHTQFQTLGVGCVKQYYCQHEWSSSCCALLYLLAYACNSYTTSIWLNSAAVDNISASFALLHHSALQYYDMCDKRLRCHHHSR